MFNFPTWIPDCDSFGFILPSDAIICSTMTFPAFGNSDHVAASVSVYFPINSKLDAHFIA